jgi:hypothetical protein
MRTIRFVFLLLLAAAVAGCSVSAGGRTSTPHRSLNGPITVEEIQASPATNALDLVRSLRPQWLRTRGSSRVGAGPDVVAVYLNNLRLGGPAELRELTTTQVESVQYLDARQAQLRFGTGHEAGVILATSRR